MVVVQVCCNSRSPLKDMDMWGRVERADMKPVAMLLVGELPLTGQLP